MPPVSKSIWEYRVEAVATPGELDICNALGSEDWEAWYLGPTTMHDAKGKPVPGSIIYFKRRKFVA